MARLTYAPLALAALFAAAGCSSKSSNTPTFDAPPPAPDAKPPDAGIPDALVCTLPSMMCATGACTDTSMDPNNCGKCGTVCQGGAFCAPVNEVGACQCPSPADFLPASITGTTIDSIQTYQIGGGTDSSNNGIVVVASTTQKTGTFTLAGEALPIVIAGYDVTSIFPPAAKSAFVATAGSVTFTTYCSHEVKGTITNATFEGAQINLLQEQFNIDPNGCTFTVDSLDFDITDGTGTPCS